MQISSIVGSSYMKGFDSVKKQHSEETPSTFTSSFEKELYANILEWKSFCHKQIINKNLNYIA